LQLSSNIIVYYYTHSPDSQSKQKNFKQFTKTVNLNKGAYRKYFNELLWEIVREE